MINLMPIQKYSNMYTIHTRSHYVSARSQERPLLSKATECRNTASTVFNFHQNFSSLILDQRFPTQQAGEISDLQVFSIKLVYSYRV